MAGMPIPCWPLWVWILPGCPQLAGGTGVFFSREKRSGVFPHWWPFIRHDTERLRGLECGIVSPKPRVRICSQHGSLLRLNEKGFIHSFIHLFAPSIYIHVLVTESALRTPVPLLGTLCYENTETRLMAAGASCYVQKIRILERVRGSVLLLRRKTGE